MSVKAENIFKLAIRMQSTREGIALKDIEREYDVSRRTAERMRDTVERIFPQMEEAYSEERTKRWRLPSGVVDRLMTIDIEEVLALENSLKLAKSAGDEDQIKNLGSLTHKLKSLQTDTQKRIREPHLEALMEAEGYALRPGPRSMIDHEVLRNIRHAIKINSKIRLRYQSRGTEKTTTHKVCPYGLIYGNRNYLVAFSLNPNVLEYRLFCLSNIMNLKILEDYFTREESFSLEEYMQNSFGVFQEIPFDVVWKFSSVVARDVREWCFHSTQKLEELEDGSIIVRFTAGGRLEMDWHLYTWGDQVEDLTSY